MITTNKTSKRRITRNEISKRRITRNEISKRKIGKCRPQFPWVSATIAAKTRTTLVLP